MSNPIKLSIHYIEREDLSRVQDLFDDYLRGLDYFAPGCLEQVERDAAILKRDFLLHVAAEVERCVIVAQRKTEREVETEGDEVPF